MRKTFDCWETSTSLVSTSRRFHSPDRIHVAVYLPPRKLTYLLRYICKRFYEIFQPTVLYTVYKFEFPLKSHKM